MKTLQRISLWMLILTLTTMPFALGEAQISETRAAQLVREVNAERARYGVNPLRVSPILSAAAVTRAKEIVKRFSHTRPDGTRWSTVSKSALGENIARGHKTVDKVMAAWMSSSGHRANLLRASYGSIGVCCVKVNNVWYWVQLFGR